MSSKTTKVTQIPAKEIRAISFSYAVKTPLSGAINPFCSLTINNFKKIDLSINKNLVEVSCKVDGKELTAMKQKQKPFNLDDDANLFYIVLSSQYLEFGQSGVDSCLYDLTAEVDNDASITEFSILEKELGDQDNSIVFFKKSVEFMSKSYTKSSLSADRILDVYQNAALGSFDKESGSFKFNVNNLLSDILGVWEGADLAKNNVYEPQLVKLPEEDLKGLEFGKDLIEQSVIYTPQKYLLITNKGTPDGNLHLITDAGHNMVFTSYEPTDKGYVLSFSGSFIMDENDDPNDFEAQSCKLEMIKHKKLGGEVAKSYHLEFDKESYAYNMEFVKKREIPLDSAMHGESFKDKFLHKVSNIKLFLKGFDITEIDMLNISHILVNDKGRKDKNVFAWIDMDKSHYLMVGNYPFPYGIYGCNRASSDESTVNYLIGTKKGMEQRASHTTSVEHSYSGSLGVSLGISGQKQDLANRSLSFGYSTENSTTLSHAIKKMTDEESFVNSAFSHRLNRDNFIDKSFAFLDGQPGALDRSEYQPVTFFQSIYDLLEDDSDEAFEKLIDNYGTHYLACASYGSYTFFTKYGTKKTTLYMLQNGKKASRKKSLDFGTKSSAKIPIDGVDFGMSNEFNYGQKNLDENEKLEENDVTKTYSEDYSVKGTFGASDEHADFPIRRHFRPLSELLAPPFYSNEYPEFYKITTNIRRKYEKAIVKHMLKKRGSEEMSSHFFLIKIFPGFSDNSVKEFFSASNNWSVNGQAISQPKLVSFTCSIQGLKVSLGNTTKTLDKVLLEASYTGVDRSKLESTGKINLAKTGPESDQVFYLIGGNEKDLVIDMDSFLISAKNIDNQIYKDLVEMHENDSDIPKPEKVDVSSNSKPQFIYNDGTLLSNQTWKAVEEMDITNPWKDGKSIFLEHNTNRLKILDIVKLDINNLLNKNI
jgi:hypothetical protein